jgi:dienelactone hydrolase
LPPKTGLRYAVGEPSPRLYRLGCLCAILAIAGCAKETPQEATIPPPPPAESPAAKTAPAAEVSFKSADGRAVFADRYPAKKASAAALLLFHQAGSNAGEYAPVAPRLVKEGYDCLAVDLRSGGTKWGRKNRTGNDTGNYMAAYKDMEAALTWAKAQGYKKIAIWGSSYSASLALKLAGSHKEVSAVLAFSPGEYFDGKTTVRDWNMRNPAPTLMAFTNEEYLNAGNSMYQASSHTPLRNRRDMVLSYPGGVHGSTTLHESKNPNAKLYWQGVISFLKANVRPT